MAAEMAEPRDVVGSCPPGPPPPGSSAVPADPTLLQLPAKAPPEGQVLLAHKHSPIHELPEELWGQIPMCRARGHVPVGGLRRKLEEGGPGLWAEEEAARSNVSLTRPSHDAWGIKKVIICEGLAFACAIIRCHHSGLIFTTYTCAGTETPHRTQIVFVYCDDFLRRCFELPWVHDAEWRALLAPVLEALGVPLSKVVRCLLAAMPPGISIPPHHDTGYWVHYTHRIHLPVVTDLAKVAFRVGPTASSTHLQRYHMPEGTLVELNNQVGFSPSMHACIRTMHARPPVLFNFNRTASSP